MGSNGIVVHVCVVSVLYVSYLCCMCDVQFLVEGVTISINTDSVHSLLFFVHAPHTI